MTIATLSRKLSSIQLSVSLRAGETVRAQTVSLCRNYPTADPRDRELGGLHYNSGPTRPSGPHPAETVQDATTFPPHP